MNNRPTVIIADKSEAFLMYMSILLNRMDFEVLPVSSGLNALKMAKAVQPNLVVIGLDLHEMPGLEVIEAMRNDQDLLSIPVIMCSEDATQADACTKRGAQAFLAKPIDVEQLHDAMEGCQIYPGSQRKHMRAPYTEKVSLTWNFKTVEAQAVTLSEGGIYIRKKIPFPQGCLLDITVPLDNGQTLELEGEVIYTKQLSEDRFTMPPGMAIRFLMVNEANAKILNDQITRLLIGDLVDEQDEPIIRA